MQRIAIILTTLTTMFIAATSTGCAADDGTRVLFVVSNHGELGDTGLETGVWMAEVTHPYWAVADSGADVTIDLASPDGGDAPIDAFSVYFDFEDFLATGVADSGDPGNDRFLSSELTGHLVAAEDHEVTDADGTTHTVTRHRFTDTAKLSEVDVASYDAIYFAGGNGAMWQFPGHPDVARVVSEMYEIGNVVAAACHGTSALLDAQDADGELLVAGRRVTGFSTAEEQYLGQDMVMPMLLQDEFGVRGAVYVEAEPWQANVVTDGRIITGQNPPSAAGVGEALAQMLE